VTDWNDEEDPAAEDQEVEEDETATEDCPYCGAEVYEAAGRCPKCGRYISEEDLPAPRPKRWLVVAVVATIIVILVAWVLKGI